MQLKSVCVDQIRRQTLFYGSILIETLSKIRYFGEETLQHVLPAAAKLFVNLVFLLEDGPIVHQDVSVLERSVERWVVV